MHVYFHAWWWWYVCVEVVTESRASFVQGKDSK